MAVPTLVAYVHVGGASPITTASISWQTGDVVVVAIGNEGATSGDVINLTLSGSGLSFGSALQTHTASSSCFAAVFGCVASSGSSGTFTGTKSPAGASQTDIGVYVFRGSAGLGGSALALTRTVALTPAASSSVVWLTVDFAAAAVQTNTPTATVHNSSTPGPSASPTDTLVGTNYTYYENEIDDGTGVSTYGILGSGVGPFVSIAVEIKAGTGGGGTPLEVFPTSRAFRVGAGPAFMPTVTVGDQTLVTVSNSSITGVTTGLTLTANPGNINVTVPGATPNVQLLANPGSTATDIPIPDLIMAPMRGGY